MSHRVLKTAAPTPRCYISDLSDAVDNTLQCMVVAVSEMMERRGEYCYRKKKKSNVEKKKRLNIFEQYDADDDGDDGVGFSYK